MDLIEYYNKLYHDSLPRIMSDRYVVDELIDSPADNRFGVSCSRRLAVGVLYGRIEIFNGINNYEHTAIKCSASAQRSGCFGVCLAI